MGTAQGVWPGRHRTKKLADATLASGARFLAVAEPAFLLLAFALGALGRAIGNAVALDALGFRCRLIFGRVETGIGRHQAADSVQIEQVLLNLLRNAMEAMEAANTERRWIIIEARRTAKHAIEVSVADSGPGVAAEMTETIFDPFTTTKSLGLGMGLSISRAIIESHGGSLRMARGVRSGAMFIFDLPSVEAETSANAG